MGTTRRLDGRAALTALASALALSAGARGGEKTVDVSFPAEAVTGLPLPVQLVVHGEAELPSARLIGLDNPFRITLSSDDAVYEFPARDYRIVKPKPRNYHVPGPEELKIPLRKVKIERGEACELVLDLSLIETAPADGDAGGAGADTGRVVPGEYTVELAGPELGFEYVRRTIRLVAPNADERRLLRNLSRIESDAPRWRTFIERFPRAMAGVDAGRFSEAGRRQMQYHTLLAGLVHSASPVGELAIRQEDIEGLLPGYGTEVLVLRYEIEIARGDNDAARATRSEILAARPGSAMLLDHIAAREGTVAAYRRAARTSP